MAEQPLDGRQRRLGTHDALLALEALEHRRLLAAHVGAGAQVKFDVEVKIASLDILAKPAGFPGRLQGTGENGMRQRILGAKVNVALAGADGEAGDRHRLDQAKRVAFHQDAIRERPRIAFVRVAGNVLLIGSRIRDRAPLDAGREARAAAAAQPGCRHGIDHGIGADFPCRLQGLETLVREEVVERQRLDQPAAPERPAVLVDQVVDLVDRAESLVVVAALEQARVEQ